MNKTAKRFLMLIAALMLAVAMASCGGGGGGGGGTPAPAGNDDNNNNNNNNNTAGKITLSGTMNTVTAAPAAERKASAVANRQLIAYRAGDTSTTKTILNSQSDTTGADGKFSITVDISPNTSMDVILEAVMDNSETNVMIGFDNLSSAKTGLIGNEGTTRKALLFHYAPAEALDTTITTIDNIFDDKDIDLRTYIKDSSYNTASLRALDLISLMKTMMTTCSITSASDLKDDDDDVNKNCMANELGRTLALYDDSAQVAKMLQALEDDYRKELKIPDANFISLAGKMEYEQAAARSAAETVGVQNATLKVYRVGDSMKTLLNSSSDTTDSLGNFKVAVNLGTSSSIDVIVEALVGTSDGDSILLALEDLSGNKDTLVGNDDTSRKALMFHYAPSESFGTTISTVDGLFDGKSIDLRDYIIGANYTESTSLTSDLLSVMKAVITNCGITSAAVDNTDKNCIQGQITTQIAAKNPADDIEEVLDDLKREYRVDLGIETLAEHLQQVDMNDGKKDQDWDAIDTLAAIYDEVSNTKLSIITTESELAEILAKMSDAITAWDAPYSANIAKRVAIKDICMQLKFGETFTYSDVETAINNLRLDDNGYIPAISVEAAALASQVTSQDMITIVSQYDNIRGMFINVLVNDVGETRKNSAAAVEGFVNVLAALGESSENTSSMGQILDNWVIEWDKPSVEADLMTFLAPLDMDDPTKTEDLMRLVHDLGDLPSGATDEQIEAVLNTYLTPATTEVAMGIYHKYQTQTCDSSDYVTVGTPINLNLSPSPNCVSKEDIMDLMETHYEKELPKLEAFIDGLEAYIEDWNNAQMLIGLYNAFASETSAFQKTYNAMNSSSAAKAEIGAALDAAGVKKEIFWLVMNVAPYINTQ